MYRAARRRGRRIRRIRCGGRPDRRRCGRPAAAAGEGKGGQHRYQAERGRPEDRPAAHADRMSGATDIPANGSNLDLHPSRISAESVARLDGLTEIGHWHTVRGRSCGELRFLVPFRHAQLAGSHSRAGAPGPDRPHGLIARGRLAVGFLGLCRSQRGKGRVHVAADGLEDLHIQRAVFGLHRRRYARDGHRGGRR